MKTKTTKTMKSSPQSFFKPKAAKPAAAPKKKSGAGSLFGGMKSGGAKGAAKGGGEQGKRVGGGGLLGGLYVPSTKSSIFAQPSGDALWYPYATRPNWLDGKMPGDSGFDPLELSKPKEFLQIGVDQQNMTARSNKPGTVTGMFAPKAKAKEAQTSNLNPYENVFDVSRLRETEVIHGRWAMAAILGIAVAENQTGVPWTDAGQVIMEQPQYANFEFDIPLSGITAVEVLLMGGVEVLRNGERDPEQRCYPGGNFDPFGLAENADAPTLFNLKTAEIKHSRLAMIGMLAIFIKGLATGNGAFLNPH